jgi:sulfide:quinone oxidoreductase
MAKMGAACIASIGAGCATAPRRRSRCRRSCPTRSAYPGTGRDPKATFGEIGLAGHWMKRLLHTMFIYKAKARPGWWLIPE